MAALGKRFDATEHDTTQTDYELLLNGIYRLEVSAGDVKKDDDGNTSLNLAVDVIEPEDYAKRKFFLWLDLEHSDPEFQARGQREFARLCRAIEVDGVEDTDELLFKPFTARVKKGEAGVGKKSGKPYKAKNSISKYYFPDEGEVPPAAIDDVQPQAAKTANDNRQPAANQNRPAAAPARAAGSKPWGKK
jgi:hypothetical protein